MPHWRSALPMLRTSACSALASRRPVSDSDTGSDNSDRPPHKDLCARRVLPQCRPPRRCDREDCLHEQGTGVANDGEKNRRRASSRIAASATASAATRRLHARCKHAVVRRQSLTRLAYLRRPRAQPCYSHAPLLAEYETPRTDTSAVRFSDLPHGGATHRARTNAEKPYLETRVTHLPTFPYPRPEKASFIEEIDRCFRLVAADKSPSSPAITRSPDLAPMARTDLPQP